MRIQLNQEVTMEETHDKYDKMLNSIGFVNVERHIPGTIGGSDRPQVFSKYTSKIKDEFYMLEEERKLNILYLCDFCGAEFFASWNEVDRSNFFYLNSNGRFSACFGPETKTLEEMHEKAKGYEEKYWREQIDSISRYKDINQCICCGKKLSREPWNYYVKYVPYVVEQTMQGFKASNDEFSYQEVKNDKLAGCTSRESIQSIYIDIKGYLETQEGYYKDIDGHYEAMKVARNLKEKGIAYEKAQMYSASCNIPATTTIGTEIVADIKRDSQKLKDYILNLIKLEINIVSLEKRLPQLYYQKNEIDRVANFAGYSPKMQLMEAALEAKRNYEDSLNLKSQYQAGEFPMVQPIVPTEPIMKAPGLFNKNKVLAENEIAKENYKKELENYEKELRQYEIKKEQLLLEVEEKIQTTKSAWEKLCDKAEKFTPDHSLTEMLFKSRMDKEIEEAERTLKKLYQCRNELYGCNIIFDKYQNVVAIATFYEYLMAGRCEILEGASGAYSIYEQEIRADRIIDQLDVVITKLEDIKSNQYMIYNELRIVNQNLEYLNATMESIDKSVKNIEESAERIAYNTAATAYYSKINAELTNSLGFMMALKG